MLEVKITINLTGLKKFKKAIDQDLYGSSDGPVRKAIRQWAFRYRVFAQRRFDRLSKGGGEWPPLAPSTIAGRKKGKGKGSPAILRDTGLLFNALLPAFVSSPGAIQKDIPFGVEVGYGGGGKYPDGKATVADIASFHQKGSSHVPQRKIIIPPDTNTKTGMANDMQKALNKLAGNTINGH